MEVIKGNNLTAWSGS